jgi:plastocyanin
MPSNCSRRWARAVNDRAVLLAALLAVGSAAFSEPDHDTVRIVDMQFEPAEIVVKRGSRIVWNNDDLFPHTVTATDETFDSGSIPASSSWTFVATQPGTHVYVCALHPTMQGRLIIQ